MFQVSSIFLHVKEAQRIHLLQALSVSSGATRTTAEGGDFTFLFEMKRENLSGAVLFQDFRNSFPEGPFSCLIATFEDFFF